MGYLRNVLAALAGRPRASQSFDLSQMTPDQQREFLRIGGGMETASGAIINENSAMKVAAAWRCVNIISSAVGSLPLDLIRREDENTRKPAVGHPLRKVLTVQPNKWQTPTEFRRLLQAWLLLRGNAYARIVRAGGEVVALVPIHPSRVQPRQLSTLDMEYSVTTPEGRALVLPQRDVLHLRGMSLDGVTGLSVLSYMREALGLSLQSEKAGARMLKSGSMAGGALEHPNKLSQEAFDRLKESIERQYSGPENAGRWMILEEGLKASPLTFSAADLQFMQLRDFQRYDIAMFFGVPPHMIGATDKTTSWGTGIEQQSIGFVTYTLNDWLTVWQDTIKRDLLGPSEREELDVRIYTQGLLRGDVKARWEAYVKALQWGVMSPDEIRALEDMNPRPDGRGGVFYDPPNTAGGGGADGGHGNEPAEPAETQGL